MLYSETLEDNVDSYKQNTCIVTLDVVSSLLVVELSGYHTLVVNGLIVMHIVKFHFACRIILVCAWKMLVVSVVDILVEYISII